MIFDSYAWIELFQGSHKGKKVKQILKTRKCFTSIVTLSEITNWALKNNLNHIYYIKSIEKQSQIVPLTNRISVLAGKINFEHKRKIKDWGMLDSFIYSTALIYGLNVLTGEPSTEKDSGYVINSYDNLRIKGFRYSDEKVGAFKFVTKCKSYAADKGGDFAQNCGVIGVRLYSEKPVSYTTTYNNAREDIIWFTNDTTGEAKRYPPIIPNFVGGITSNIPLDMNTFDGGHSTHNCSCYSELINAKLKGFDMGSTWGSEKVSKVTNTEFEVGHLVHSMDIFYASRESLIEMGVPMVKETKVAFPSSFVKYATPPKGWRG